MGPPQGGQGVADRAGRAVPESGLPFRSRVAAITGALSGVDTMANWAFNPFTFEYP